MLKALCFLGTGPQGGKYSETSYVKHDDKTQFCKTDLFPEAVNQLYCPDKIIVFVTPQVKEGEYLCQLKEKLGDKLEPVDLLDILDRGNSEADMWKIFDVYQRSVEEGDEIILDITHGFRSLPMLAFPVVAYLRQVKKVALKHILYAPFDARPESEGKATQIFDLKPFVTLLDWMNAVNVFQCTGDAHPIAQLPDVPKNFSDSLRTLSANLLTNCTLRAQEAAFRFNKLSVTSPRSGTPIKDPIQKLIEELQHEHRNMALENPQAKPNESLTKQCQQIKWYVEHRHYLQAVTLIREWLISWEYLESGGSPRDWLKYSRHRESAEFKFTRGSGHPDPKARAIWENCKIRNELAHCGMRTSAIASTTAIRRINDLYKDFEQFARDKGVLP